MKKLFLLIQLTILSAILLSAKEPLSKNYSGKDFNAHPLIWNIIHDAQGNLWMANNEGVLRFDGNNWNLYPTPKPARCLAFDQSGNLFIASEGDLGVLINQKNGVKNYFSFKDQLGSAKEKSSGDKSVLLLNNEIYFTSSQYLFKVINNAGNFEIKMMQIGPISGSFVYKNKLYINHFNKGLCNWNGTALVPILSAALLKGKTIVAVSQTKSNLIIGTNFDGLYKLNETGLSAINSPANNFAKSGLAYLSTNTLGDIAIGTFHNGVQIFNNQQNWKETCKLPSNEIYTLYFDAEDNLWTANRKGITHTNLNLPITYFPEFGLTSFVSDLIIKNNSLFLATNNGLFETNVNNPTTCNLYSNINGECWALSDKYIASTNGFLDYSAKNYFPNETFTFIQKGNKNKSTNYVFSNNACYSFQDGDGIAFHKIAGIDEMANSIYENEDGSFWIGTSYNGLLKIPAGNFNQKEIPPTLSQSEVIVREKDGKPIFQASDGIYNYDGKSFVLNSQLSSLFLGSKSKQLSFGNSFWLFTKNELRQVVNNEFNQVSQAYAINGKPTAICENQGKIWLAFEDKIYLFEPKKTIPISYNSSISRITNGNGEIVYDGLETEISVVYEHSGLQFEFGINSFINPDKNNFRYRINGIQDQWTEWSNSSKLNLNKIPAGKYTIEIEGKTATGEIAKTSTIQFTIKAPWYLSLYAYILYGLALFLLTLVIIKINTKVLITKNKRLENLVGERTKQLELNNIDLKSEKKKSDDLLLNILPEEIAEELKTKGRSEAKLYQNVSVLFTDFVNFTGISEQMSPTELVQEIHRNFTAFDAIMEKHHVEKIKTIGDAYLAVCGLPHENIDHAKNIVAAALDIQNFMNTSGSKFQIRIGINSGPVVAGIVGVKKYAYDIWGDTVNTAARMEQSSEAGKINISGATYELIKNNYRCEHRGKINAKNKGAVDMYFVTL